MNVILGLLVLIGAGLLIYFILFSKIDKSMENLTEEVADKFSLSYLSDATVDDFNEILQQDYTILNLNKAETLKNQRNQGQLRHALQLCAVGDFASKSFIKEGIQGQLIGKHELDIDHSENLFKVIPFDKPELLTVQDRFEILLYLYQQKFGSNAFNEFMIRNGLDKPRGSGSEAFYEVSASDIDVAFRRNYSLISKFTYYNYIEIITQRVYQMTYGLGVIDTIRDLNIDGINIGTSGIPDSFVIEGSDGMYGAAPGELPNKSFNAVWVMYKGVMYRMSCIGFGSQGELERVCKLIYRYDSPGTLDKSRGYIVSQMKDGCRVTVARPNMSESWVAFVRKFGSADRMSLYDLYPFRHNDYLVETIKWIVKGLRNIALTGAQATGKTTCLGSMIQFVPPSLGIRVQEMAFELRIRKSYPERNIVTFAETSTVSAQEGIDFMKKTDGTIGVFGEVAQAAVATLAIQMGQVGMSQVIFTHHAKTVPSLIRAVRDNMIEAAGFNNEQVVEVTVASVINFNIHLKRTINGVRYIDRISEIVPFQESTYPEDITESEREYFYRITDRQLFKYWDILKFDIDKQEYYFNHQLSDESIEAIRNSISAEERVQFDKFVQFVGDSVRERVVA